MNIEDIYSRIAQRMIRGMMIHQQMTNYYNFLGLPGYSKCHQYHYLEETKSFIDINKFYIQHYNKLIQELPVDASSIIPSNWFQYTRQDVDNDTKRRAIEKGMQTWIEWEQDTKNIYQNLYKECFNIGYIFEAMKIQQLIIDVSEQLAQAKQYYLNKKMIDYDLKEIVPQQKEKEKYFNHKIKK